MPYYEYRCAANGRTVEVRHHMDEELRTWGDACARAGIDPGDTPDDAPLERLISAPVPVSAAEGRDVDPCGPGCACAHRV